MKAKTLRGVLAMALAIVLAVSGLTIVSAEAPELTLAKQLKEETMDFTSYAYPYKDSYVSDLSPLYNGTFIKATGGVFDRSNHNGLGLYGPSELTFKVIPGTKFSYIYHSYNDCYAGTRVSKDGVNWTVANTAAPEWPDGHVKITVPNVGDNTYVKLTFPDVHVWDKWSELLSVTYAVEDVYTFDFENVSYPGKDDYIADLSHLYGNGFYKAEGGSFNKGLTICGPSNFYFKVAKGSFVRVRNQVAGSSYCSVYASPDGENWQPVDAPTVWDGPVQDQTVTTIGETNCYVKISFPNVHVWDNWNKLLSVSYNPAPVITHDFENSAYPAQDQYVGDISPLYRDGFYKAEGGFTKGLTLTAPSTFYFYTADNSSFKLRTHVSGYSYPSITVSADGKNWVEPADTGASWEGSVLVNNFSIGKGNCYVKVDYPSVHVWDNWNKVLSVTYEKGYPLDKVDANLTVPAVKPGEETTITVAEGKEVKAGSLRILNANGDVVAVPQRVGFRTENLSSAEYTFTMPSGGVQVVADYVDENDAEPNMGQLGWSKNAELGGLRSIFRMPVYEKEGVYYTTGDVEIDEFGVIVGTAEDITTATAKVKKINFLQEGMRYDIADVYQDVSVTVTGLKAHPDVVVKSCGYIVIDGETYYTAVSEKTYA